MILQPKSYWSLAGAALLLLLAGCSGINTTHSVSPASFFLPGLLKADPPPATNDLVLPVSPAASQVALAR